MTWFLRLFPRFRALEAQVREMANEKIRLDDNQRWMQSRMDELSKSRDKAVEEALYSTRVNADFVAQHTVGRSIYGLAPELPERTDMEPAKRDTVSAREIERELMTPDAVASIIAGLENDLGVNDDAKPAA